MVETITSMKPEEWEGEICSGKQTGTKVRLIDFPGHPRLRTYVRD
jgi:signal recognition particle receptor subunit beta